MSAQSLNLLVLLAYLAIIIGVGVYFSLKRKSAEQFMTAGGHMPGWAVGFSMFGSYVSAISFVANPGSTYSGNWLYATFTLMTPVGLLVGTTYFMKFYRRSGSVSAYEHFERRFGTWARTYAVFAYLVGQTARTGTILYLLARTVLPLMGKSGDDTRLITLVIVGCGVMITLYTLWGGIEAVVWCGVVQSIVLLLGPLICLVTILIKMPDGVGSIFSTALANHKLGLGPYDFQGFAVPTFWIVAMSAILEHLRNWGTDQSYIQRYISTPTEREASKSIWTAGLLYMPVAFMFFFLGTALFAFYQQHGGTLPDKIGADGVLPHFIVTQVAPGLAGLVIAAVFAASMDSNLNSMATLTLVDGYQRFLRPNIGPRESLAVLWSSTAIWGVLSIGWGLFVMYMTVGRGKTTLEFNNAISGLVMGGVLGMFLLTLLSKRVNGPSALIATILGVLVITWMTFSKLPIGGQVRWPASWPVSPFNEIYAGTIGTAVIVVVGVLLGALLPRRATSSPTIA